MKKALLKDSVKEIKNTYKRFISILLMAFLGVGFFAGIRAASPDMLDTIDQYYKEQNVFDIEILSTLGLTQQDIEEISKIENVEAVDGAYEIDGKIETESKETITKFITIGDINKTLLLEGELPVNENECLVEESFLSANNKSIGDTIQVEIEETTNDNGDKIQYLKNNEMKIVGTVQSPLYISRDRGSSNLGAGKINYYVYIPKENINATDVYTNIYIKVKDADKYTTSSDKYEDYIEDVKDSIEQIKGDTENPKWYILDRNSNTGYVGFIEATDSIGNIGKVFPVIFFAVAALISLTSMTRMVEEQRTQIGTLKALGYSKIQIMGKYILYASLASIIGGITGMCLGFYTLPQIVWEMYSMMYQITDKVVLSFRWGIGSLGLILICVCIIGATIYAVIRELKETPAILMRPKAPKMGNRVLLEKIPFIWKHLNFSHKVTVRNIFRYKKRFFMTIIGISGCTALILTGFALKDSIKAVLPNQFENVFTYDMQINIKNEEFISDIQENENIEKTVETYMTSVKAVNGEIQEDVQVIVPKDNFDGLINIKDLKTKQQIELKDNEICLTEKVAQLLDINVGDTIKLRNNDNEEYEVKITYIVENYVSHYVYMSKITYENLTGKQYKTNVILTKNKELTEEQEDVLTTELMKNANISAITRTSTIMKILDDTLKSLDYVVIILIVSAGLLAFVVLYNLSNVNISERIRELATIKVLGFYNKEVYDYVTRETIILTIIGIILGLAGGYFLNFYILRTCEINTLRFAKIVNPISYVYAILITVVFTVIVNIATYFALKKIDMIESLKSVE